MKTATFVGIDADPKSTIVYADAELSNGKTIHGLGFSFEDGKFDAMWDLVQRLDGIELEVRS